MWIYEKKLQFPVRIKNPNPKMAQVILSQYGGPYTKCLVNVKIKKLYYFKNKMKRFLLFAGAGD